MKDRFLWIDMMKGLGILCIVWAHITGQLGTFIFAVTMFFVISGFLFSPIDSLSKSLSKYSKRLLVPYFTFYFIIAVIQIIESETKLDAIKKIVYNIVRGGNYLTSDYGAFWFIGVLFFALLTFNFIIRCRFHKIVFGVLFLLTFLISYINKDIYWSLQALPLGLCLMYAGHLLNDWQAKVRPVGTVTCVLMTLFIVALTLIPNIHIDIKWNYYGIPVLSLLLSLLCIIILAYICKTCEKNPVGTVLSKIGNASIFIMFVHQVIRFRLNSCCGIDNKVILYLVTVIISFALFLVVDRYRLSQILLLGKSSKSKS